MNFRLSTVRRNGKVYQSVQLVESYGRERDGKPTCRVVASLGALDDVAIGNLRAALAASRTGTALVIPAAAAADPEPEVLANLRYLDLAVLLRMWEDLGLSRLIRASVASTEARAVEVERVIAALVLHRCVAAGSKLAAERWFPTTALPELLGVLPSQFNNSRVHRALSSIQRGDAALQAGLAGTVAEREGTFATAFIDATDTWFVGQGPPLAARGMDKEGIYRRPRRHRPAVRPAWLPPPLACVVRSIPRRNRVAGHGGRGRSASLAPRKTRRTRPRGGERLRD